MNVADLYAACTKLMGAHYPTGMVAVPAPSPRTGRGFFPVVSGSFFNATPRSEVRRKLMFVGQDWGTVRNVAALAKNPHADVEKGTGKKLGALLAESGIAVEECFFTNALFGVRTGTTNTGRSPGWKDSGFVDRCTDALRLQISTIRPRAVVCLGRDAPDLLVRIFPECQVWRAAPTFAAIDSEGCGLLTVTPKPKDSVVAAAILVHPSYRHINARHRRFGETCGHSAEVRLLRILSAQVK